MYLEKEHIKKENSHKFKDVLFARALIAFLVTVKKIMTV